MEECVRSQKGLAELTQFVTDAYWKCLGILGNKEHRVDQGYSFLLYKNFMLVVLRSSEALREGGRSVGINSLGFSGTIAV